MFVVFDSSNGMIVMTMSGNNSFSASDVKAVVVQEADAPSQEEIHKYRVKVDADSNFTGFELKEQ